LREEPWHGSRDRRRRAGRRHANSHHESDCTTPPSTGLKIPSGLTVSPPSMLAFDRCDAVEHDVDQVRRIGVVHGDRERQRHRARRRQRAAGLVAARARAGIDGVTELERRVALRIGPAAIA
jgi:hypothetical protein